MVCMKVKVRFLAMAKDLPQAFTEIEIQDNARLETLKNELWNTWGGIMAVDRQEFNKNFMIASGSCLLHEDASLFEGQEISVIGHIIGG